MKIISADQLAEAASYRDIVEALRQGFREDIATGAPSSRHLGRGHPAAHASLVERYDLKTVVVKTEDNVIGVTDHHRELPPHRQPHRRSRRHDGWHRAHKAAHRRGKCLGCRLSRPPGLGNTADGRHPAPSPAFRGTWINITFATNP